MYRVHAGVPFDRQKSSVQNRLWPPSGSTPERGLTPVESTADVDTLSSSFPPPDWPPCRTERYEIGTTCPFVNSGSGFTVDVGLLSSPPFATVVACGMNRKAGTTVNRSRLTRTAVLIPATLLDVEPLIVEMRGGANEAFLQSRI